MNVEGLFETLKGGIAASSQFNIDDGAMLTLKCDVSNIERAVSMLKRRLSLKITEKTFKEAKEKALSDIKQEKESASDKRVVDKYGITNLKNSKQLEDALEKVTINDVRQYYNELLNNSYSLVVASLPFDKNPELFNKLASLLNFPNHQFKKADNNIFTNAYYQNTISTVYTARNNNTQPNFEKIFNYKITSNPKDDLCFKLLSQVLNKRIFDDLREKQGLAYTAYAYNSNYGNNGIMGMKVSSSCSNKDDIKKIFDGFEKHCARLINEQISEKELNDAKELLKKDILTEFDEMSGAQAVVLDAMKSPCGFELYKNSFDIINKLTVADIQTAARYVFSAKPDYLIDADENFINENTAYLKTLGEIKE